MLTAGDRIGKYRVVRLLGKGGMGMVYVGWDDDLKREVALKVMNPKVQGVENALKRFQAEAQAIARLSNQHIVQVYEFNPQGEMPFIAMEYVRGRNLAEMIREEAPMAIEVVLNCARQALAGLACAHKAGIIHRDIKPANMILSDENVLKIMDFGLARSLDVESGLTAEGAVVGTIHYLAPEVARGEAATAQSDLYSLGVALYEMLTSRVPFDEESPLKLISRIARETPPPVQAWRDDLPPAVAAWLHKMLASDVEQRYQTAQDALADLARISYQSFPLHDPLRQSDGASTVEITPTPVAGDPAKDGKKENRPLTGVKEGDIDAIISEALRIEKEGREVLHEDSLMEIAAEVGVSAEAVRAALRERQEAIARQQRRQKIIRIAVASAAALVILAFILAVALRPTPKAPRTYQMAGRGVKDLGEKNSPLPKPNAIAVDEKWREVGLSLTGNRAILAIRVIEGKEVECRVGDSAPFTVEGAYYGAPGGEGALLARAPAGAAKIAAAALAPLRMAAMPFSASETGSAQSNLADGTGDLIATRLAERKCFEIVERVQVQKILANLNLENTKHFDPKTAGRIGRMLGVDYLITGAVQEAGGRYRLSAKRLAAETGEVLENAVLDGTDIFALQDRLAQELVQKIQATELARFLP